MSLTYSYLLPYCLLCVEQPWAPYCVLFSEHLSTPVETFQCGLAGTSAANQARARLLSSKETLFSTHNIRRRAAHIVHAQPQPRHAYRHIHALRPF